MEKLSDSVLIRETVLFNRELTKAKMVSRVSWRHEELLKEWIAYTTTRVSTRLKTKKLFPLL